ncbi:lipopolysaccharide heptosyltransferase II [Mariprofundus erugo]|uniref:lipopolysaccharide heptosyltransferase II n=1 Tax=Mariprofundus erugo TaxID=2528639 RepID=UPI0010FE3E8B|nr:lipopolysaccharide heptosyltransferase II [Mariprofundus erugo]TLS73943.1 lipopolysaccharide heptosyltransferase II [Mariprofundus erugo]
MKPVHHLLLMPPNWIGDVIMAQPAMFAVASHYRALNPALQITVCGRPWLKDLLPWLNLAGARYAEQLPKADTAFLFPNSLRSAWQCRKAGIRSIIGYSGQWRSLLLSRALPQRISQKHQHHRDFFLDIATQSGMAIEQRYVHLSTPADAVEEGINMIRAHGLNPEKSFMLAPGAQFGAAKCYPEAGFAEACRHLASHGFQPVVLGMKEDHATGERILADLDVATWNAAGATTLSQAIALIGASRFMLCNDSGLMHIAAGLDIPTVAPFGATDPERTAPSGKHVKIIYQPAPCSPCLQRECTVTGHPCMSNITPRMLSDACLALLKP